MSNFIHEFWRAHASDTTPLVVRFPPEPNGYLHIGHVKALLANADIAEAFNGRLLLRMDDTNPCAEKAEYAAAILDDIRWLGVAVEETVRHASDHFLDLLSLARCMIEAGEAYIDTSSKEDLARMRGNFTTPGVPSPDRERPREWHAARFEELIAGKGSDGSAVLRAKLDLAGPNMALRDPVFWRRMAHPHPRMPGWIAFPTYDFAHPFCDLRDGVTLSLCSLEFEEHRPLYDHVVARAVAHGFSLGLPAPVEVEFARLEPSVGITSKRAIKAAVDSGAMSGWDDPRLLTLRGLRTRGYEPEMIKRFVRRLGVSRALSRAPMEWLEEEVREVAGKDLPGMVISDPVPLVLSGVLPAFIKLPREREVPSASTCMVGRDDVRAAGGPGFRRLAPGAVVRLMGWDGFIEVEKVSTDGDGRVIGAEGRFRAEGKSKTTVHALPEGACEAGIMIHTRTWDGKEDPDECETRAPVLIERGAIARKDVFHAPRVGWLRNIREGEWRLLAGMVVRPGR